MKKRKTYFLFSALNSRAVLTKQEGKCSTDITLRGVVFTREGLSNLI